VRLETVGNDQNATEKKPLKNNQLITYILPHPLCPAKNKGHGQFVKGGWGDLKGRVRGHRISDFRLEIAD
jgi:hypothetical protein